MKLMITVTVIYARPVAATELEVEVPAGSTVADALARSGIAARHPEIGAVAHGVGIYGSRVAPDSLLADGDRIEIYRPLLADPKEGRRRRGTD
jgi:hypothetical protein